jgi:hypothetical protein
MMPLTARQRRPRNLAPFPHPPKHTRPMSKYGKHEHLWRIHSQTRVAHPIVAHRADHTATNLANTPLRKNMTNMANMRFYAGNAGFRRT